MHGLYIIFKDEKSSDYYKLNYPNKSPIISKTNDVPIPIKINIREKDSTLVIILDNDMRFLIEYFNLQQIDKELLYKREITSITDI
jgi:hypothetical protein